MKKVFKIAGGVLTAVLYSIAVFIFTENAKPQFSSVFETQTSGNRISFYVSPSGILGIPLTQESSVNLFSGTNNSISDSPYKSFSACLKYAEKTISSEFVQYVFQSKNFQIRLRKADFLFPFHYFW